MTDIVLFPAPQLAKKENTLDNYTHITQTCASNWTHSLGAALRPSTIEQRMHVLLPWCRRAPFAWKRGFAQRRALCLCNHIIQLAHLHGFTHLWSFYPTSSLVYIFIIILFFFFSFSTAATQISLASFDERGQIFFPSAPTPDLFLIPTENWAHSSLFQSKLPGGASRESGPASFLIYLLLKEIRIPFAFRGAAHHRVHLMITGRLLLRFRDRHGSKKKGTYSCGFEARIWITKKGP